VALAVNKDFTPFAPFPLGSMALYDVPTFLSRTRRYNSDKHNPFSMGKSNSFNIAFYDYL